MVLLCKRHGFSFFAACFVVLGLSSAGVCSDKPSNPTFAKRIMILGGENLTVEMAITPEQLEHGLMFRQKLADNEGMLFIFSHEQVLSFWMKNTFIPLAIGFFDKNKKLIDIQEMAAVKSEIEMHPPIYQSRKPAMYALEVNKGWFARHHVKLGQAFSLKKGNMRTKPVMRKQK